MKVCVMIELKALIIDKPENKAFHTNQAPGIFKPMITALRTGGIDAACIAPQDESDIVMAVEKGGPDIVFCAASKIPVKKGGRKNAHLILEELQVPYIGSPPEVLDQVLNKPALKALWSNTGIRTPAYREFHSSNLDDLATLDPFNNYPYIIKPTNGGNSKGIDCSSVVKDEIALKKKTSEMLLEFGDVMVEKYLGMYADFQEITVAWIGNGDSALIMPAEIHLAIESPAPVISTQVKDAHLTRTSQVEDDTLWKEILDFSRQAFTVAGIRDYARLDLIHANGQIHAIEINGQPMIPDRWFEACAFNVGLNQEQYINSIFLAGIVRLIHAGWIGLKIPENMEKIIPRPIFQLLTQ